MPAQHEKAITKAFKIAVSVCKTEMFSRALKKLVPSVTLMINKREHCFENIFDIALENKLFTLVVQERT